MKARDGVAPLQFAFDGGDDIWPVKIDPRTGKVTTKYVESRS
jgi:hypothetical protein